MTRKNRLLWTVANCSELRHCRKILCCNLLQGVQISYKFVDTFLCLYKCADKHYFAKTLFVSGFSDFGGFSGFFSVCNREGCSGTVRHPAADLKMPFPQISGDDRIFLGRNVLFTGLSLKQVLEIHWATMPGCELRMPGLWRIATGWTQIGESDKITV